jgi:hypothetical protein
MIRLCFPQGVVVDEMFKPSYLTVCKLPKLHPTSPHSDRRERNFAGSEIPDRLKGNVIYIGIIISQKNIQPARPIRLFLCRQIAIRQPAHADVDNFTKPAIVRAERKKHTDWDPKPLVFSSFNPFFLHLGSRDVQVKRESAAGDQKSRSWLL